MYENIFKIQRICISAKNVCMTEKMSLVNIKIIRNRVSDVLLEIFRSKVRLDFRRSLRSQRLVIEPNPRSDHPRRPRDSQSGTSHFARLRLTGEMARPRLSAPGSPRMRPDERYVHPTSVSRKGGKGTRSTIGKTTSLAHDFPHVIRETGACIKRRSLESSFL